MKILALDTSTWTETVALLEDGSILSERVVVEKESHNRRLLATIEAVLKDAQCSVKEVDAIAVGIGPGSFTGIRIGITTAKALAWSLRKPVIGIPSLDALAFPFGFWNGYVCPMIDARKKEVYYAIYRVDGTGRLIHESRYGVASPLKVLNEISGRGIKNIIFCGDGWKAYKEKLLSSIDGSVIIDPPDVFNYIRASHLGAIAWDRICRGTGLSSPFELLPLYVRPSEAELKRIEMS